VFEEHLRINENPPFLLHVNYYKKVSIRIRINLVVFELLFNFVYRFMMMDLEDILEV